MFTVLLYTIGSGVRTGTHGVARGTGITGRLGGTRIIAGHMIGTGITAMLTIIITTGARSGPDARLEAVTMSCIRR